MFNRLATAGVETAANSRGFTSALTCGREPYAWLLYTLERLPLARTVDAVEALLPWNVHDQDLATTLTARE